MNANAGRKWAHKSYLFPHWSNACPGARLRVGITHQHLPLLLPRGSLLCDRGCSHCVHSPLSARDHPLWQKRWSLEVLQSSMGGSGILMPHIWKKRCEEASWFHGILDVVIEEQQEAYLGWHFFVFGRCWVQWSGRFCQVDEGDLWCRSDPTPWPPPPTSCNKKGWYKLGNPVRWKPTTLLAAIGLAGMPQDTHFVLFLLPNQCILGIPGASFSSDTHIG